MLPLSALLLAATVCLEASAPVQEPPVSDTLSVLWQQARSWPDFLRSAVARRELWDRNSQRATVDDALIARASAAGRWRLLIVAEDACSDSANTLPWIAALAARVPGLEIRIINSRAGRGIMESHRTPDGRAATPTLLVLDAQFSERGCWVERPSELQRWYIAERAGLSDDQYRVQKQAWYDRDQGRSTVVEVVEVLEAAAAGRQRCR